MLDIPGGQEFAGGDRLGRLADQNPVHDDFIPNIKVPNGELMLRGNVVNRRMPVPLEFERLTRLEIGERDQNIVPRIELENCGRHTNQAAPLQSRRCSGFRRVIVKHPWCVTFWAPLAAKNAAHFHPVPRQHVQALV